MLNYSHVLFKDKTDQTPEFRNLFPGAQYVGAMEKLNPSERITVMSVKFSGVGELAYKAFPNLKYIVCRSHDTDKINLDLCRQHNVEVKLCYPTVKNVAKYIINHLKAIGAQFPYLFYGYGRIAKEVILQLHLCDAPILYINSKTSYEERQVLMRLAKTLIITVPNNASTEKIITLKELGNFRGKVISVSHSGVLSNYELLWLIKYNCIEYIVADCLANDHRIQLAETKKVLCTNHRAWDCDTALLQQEYIAAVKECVDNLS